MAGEAVVLVWKVVCGLVIVGVEGGLEGHWRTHEGVCRGEGGQHGVRCVCVAWLYIEQWRLDVARRSARRNRGISSRWIVCFLACGGILWAGRGTGGLGDNEMGGYIAISSRLCGCNGSDRDGATYRAVVSEADTMEGYPGRARKVGTAGALKV